VNWIPWRCSFVHTTTPTASIATPGWGNRKDTFHESPGFRSPTSTCIPPETEVPGNSLLRCEGLHCRSPAVWRGNSRVLRRFSSSVPVWCGTRPVSFTLSTGFCKKNVAPISMLPACAACHRGRHDNNRTDLFQDDWRIRRARYEAIHLWHFRSRKIPSNFSRLTISAAFSLSLTGRTSAFKDVKNSRHQFQAREVHLLRQEASASHAFPLRANRSHLICQ